MPLYEYQCDACGHRFEVIQKYSDPLVDICPKCGSTVHKLISSPAIQFKGSGFYITDYAKKDYVDASKADGNAGGEGKSDSGSTDKTEKTPGPTSGQAEKSLRPSSGQAEKSSTAESSSQPVKSEKSEKSEKSSSSSDASSSSSSSSSTTKPQS